MSTLQELRTKREIIRELTIMIKPYVTELSDQVDKGDESDFMLGQLTALDKVTEAMCDLGEIEVDCDVD